MHHADLDTTVLPRTTRSPAPAPAAGSADGAPEPAPRRRRERRAGTAKRWISRFVVLLMTAAAVLGGIKLTEYRRAEVAQVNLGAVTLTAAPATVSTLTAGVVASVDVQARQQVAAGQTLATLTVLKPSATDPSKTITTTEALKAPIAGVVASQPVGIGSSLAPGQTFVQLYDPSALTLVASVPIRELSHIGVGMPATLTGPGLQAPIRASVQRVVPVVTANGTAGMSVSHSTMQLVLTPVHMSDVVDLVPGYQFTGTVAADPGATPKNGVLGGS